MSSLSEKISQLSSTNDTKKKLTIGQDIIDYLGHPENPVECDDLGGFIDMLVPFMQSSNFKVSQNGLDIVGLLIERMGPSFRPYVNTVMPAAIDRLGDTRETVREKAGFLISKLLEEDVLEPQVLFEKNIGAFSHKNGKVREELLILLQNTLNIYGAQSLTVTKFLASIVALLSDPTASVRDAAFSTLVEIYTHIGERLRIDLQRKHQVPPAKLPILMSKFDAARANGDMKPTATLGMGTTDGNNRGDDETDRQSIKSASSSKSRSSSVPARRQVFAAPKPPSAGGGIAANTENGNSSKVNPSSSVRRNPSMRLGSSGATGQAGAVDEESFIQAFEEVPKKVTIFNGRSVADELNKIKDTLAKTSNDWKVRIDALQMMRALLMAGADQYDEMLQALRTLEVPFQSSVKDLRSQVVREACITIGYMSQQLRHRVDRFLEALMQNIINLIPNSAKVMSSSGIVCMRFIIQNTYSARFIPILTSNVSSKSRDIRRHGFEFIQQLLHTWPTHALEKHKDILQESIKKGISDADPDARVFARKAFWGFADHFKDQADTLLNSLDNNHRRMLQSSGVSGNMSNSSSSNSLNLTGRNTGSSISGAHTMNAPGHASSSSNVFLPARSRQSSVTSSKENLLDGDMPRKTQTLTRKHSGIPMYSSPTKADASPNHPFMNNGSPRQTPPARSNSAIDASAVRRASVRAQYAHRHRLGAIPGVGGIGASLPRPRKSSEGKMGIAQSPVTPNNAMRNGGRSRSSITHSQPGSRSTSPTSLSSYATYFSHGSGQTSMGVTPRSRRTSSGIPRSTGPSRETSPNRYSGGYGQRRIGTGRSGITPDRPPKRPQMTEKILKQSLEAETALAEALKSSPRKNSRTNSHGLFDDGDRSDESETSSICSERSYPDFGRRSSDGFGIRGGDSRERLYWDPVNQDIGEIIANCASTHWADRKDGLIGLQCYFKDGRMLTGSELRRVTDIFARMFMDAHTKVFTLFLDSLIELVVTHKEDLRDWLHILITRLLNKLGADLLGSIVQKIYRTLDVIKESFPLPDQLTVLMRFLVDQAITPNVKVKVATMKQVANISQTMESLSLSQGAQTGLLLSDSDEQMALAKIITWTYEPKSPEVRKHSQAALISLFRLNASNYGRILAKLPKSFQDNATPLVSSHLMNESTATLTPTDSSDSPTTDSGDTLPTLKSTLGSSLLEHGKNSIAPDSLLDSTLLSVTGPSPMKPRSLHSTNSIEGGLLPTKKNASATRGFLDPSDDAENLNPEEIHQSLRSTANAIQNYTFDPDIKGDKYSSSAIKDVNIPILREPKNDNLSEEISNSNGGGKGDQLDLITNFQDPTAMLEEKMSLLDINGSKFANGNQAQVNKNNMENLARGEENRLAINDIIEELQNIKSQSRSNERKACMTQLIRMSRDGQIGVIQDNFRTLLRLLLENLVDEIGATRALVFGVLTEMLKQEQLIPCFQGYTELIILKVLESHRDPEKDVERAAEGCAAAMAGVLPADKVIQVLNPIIKTGDYPVNQAAVKMLTKVAEHESSKEVVSTQLGSIMPGLLKAYDDDKSSVRKASVICLAALYLVVDQHLQPYISTLPRNKQRMLQLYIKKSAASTSTNI